MKLALFLFNTLLVIALFSMTAYNLFSKKDDTQLYSVKKSEKKAAAAKRIAAEKAVAKAAKIEAQKVNQWEKMLFKERIASRKALSEAEDVL